MTPDPKGGFLQALEEAARQSRDIDELAALLRAFPEVHSVEVRDYLVKTQPPIRELAIHFQNTRFVADITLHPDGSLTVRGLHDC
ncbi:MAG: hypothetical protein AAB403_20475 [Planctomycetota bacterium]